jgi:hypothetical protein
MAESRTFYTAGDRKPGEELPAGRSDEDITGRVSEEDDEEFDAVDELDEDEEDVDESDR